MNPRTLGLLRELLAAAGAALVVYGFGTESLWQEVAGGILAGVCLIFGILHNTGAEAWYSLARKVISAIAGVLVVTGTIQPDKAQVLGGFVMSMLAMVWSAIGKDPGGEPPGPVDFPMILLMAAACVFLCPPSCAGYPLTGSVYYRDPSSGAKAGMAFRPGEAPRASVRIPIYDQSTGEVIGMADLSGGMAVINRESGK